VAHQAYGNQAQDLLPLVHSALQLGLPPGTPAYVYLVDDCIDLWLVFLRNCASLPAEMHSFFKCV
jgi:hypothetical protein